MLEEKELKIIEEKTKEFFERMGLDVEIEMNYLKEENDIMEINVFKIEDAKMFIGKQGLILGNLQLILRKIIKKELDKEIYLTLDIDNYRKNKINSYKSIANSAAEEVSTTGQQKILPPLSSYARRIIHMELAKRNDVETESVGMGDQRRLVVKPKL
ncbi:MAG: protein jag [Minisyncoccales bacterium]|jgi:spoIIIJ-associated protein